MPSELPLNQVEIFAGTSAQNIIACVSRQVSYRVRFKNFVRLNIFFPLCLFLSTCFAYDLYFLLMITDKTYNSVRYLKYNTVSDNL